MYGADVPSFAMTYADTSIIDVYEAMFALPQDLAIWVVGSGEIVRWSDIGYVKIIWLGGVPLLGLVILFYVSLFVFLRGNLRRVTKASANRDDRATWIKILWITLSVTLVLLFLSNFKNLYWFTRGYHEFFVVVSALIIGFSRYARLYDSREVVRARSRSGQA